MPTTRRQLQAERYSNHDTEDEYESATETEIESNTLDNTVVNVDTHLTETLAGMQVQQRQFMELMQQQLLQQQTVMQKMTESLNATRVDTNARHDAMRAKKFDYPTLGPVHETTMADFHTWQEGFKGYVSVSRLNNECNLEGRRAIIRSALDSEWQKLWHVGMLGINQTDDVEQVINCIREYIRQQRNPLLDRRDFYRRNQQSGEKINSYFADLQVLYDSCDFEDDNMICPHDDCDQPCGHGKGHMLREERLCEKLIFGLSNESFQQKVLEENLKDFCACT